MTHIYFAFNEVALYTYVNLTRREFGENAISTHLKKFFSLLNYTLKNSKKFSKVIKENFELG